MTSAGTTSETVGGHVHTEPSRDVRPGHSVRHHVLAHQKELGRLETLDLSGNYVSASSREQLAGVWPNARFDRATDSGDDDDEDDYDEDDSDEDDRYEDSSE